MEQEYAVYKGEDLLIIGTAIECAVELDVKPETIRWYTSPTGKKRQENRVRQDECIFVVKL